MRLAKMKQILERLFPLLTKKMRTRGLGDDIYSRLDAESTLLRLLLTFCHYFILDCSRDSDFHDKLDHRMDIGGKNGLSAYF